MSHTALRRVAIRLLHDPTFVDALHADPTRALGDADLTGDERRWLLAVPRAAWRADAGRPDRVLAALGDEFPATIKLAPARAGRFLRSVEFHTAVQERGSLAMAFGAYMASDRDRRVTAIARLERAVAAVRRAPAAIEPSETGCLRLTPAARVMRTPSRAADLLAALRAGTDEPSLGADEEAVLVLRTDTGADVTIESLPADLAVLLDRAASQIPRSELEGAIRSSGSSAAEAVEIVDGLLADGLLR